MYPLGVSDKEHCLTLKLLQVRDSRNIKEQFKQTIAKERTPNANYLGLLLWEPFKMTYESQTINYYVQNCRGLCQSFCFFSLFFIFLFFFFET